MFASSSADALQRVAVCAKCDRDDGGRRGLSGRYRAAAVGCRVKAVAGRDAVGRGGAIFLYGFHDEKLLEARPEQGAFIATETEPLAGLWEVNREVVLKASRKEEPKQATIDQDATVVESHKEQSQMTYLGERGYQPVINYWAEQDLILADEFRDGNVPAGMDCLSSFLRATRALLQSVETIYFRSDSAAYQHKLLDKMREGVE